jgi:hypothetical protein
MAGSERQLMRLANEERNEEFKKNVVRENIASG